MIPLSFLVDGNFSHEAFIIRSFVNLEVVLAPILYVLAEGEVILEFEAHEGAEISQENSEGKEAFLLEAFVCRKRVATVGSDDSAPF